MTTRLRITTQTTLALAAAVLMLLSASAARASEVVGTLSSGSAVATGSSATGTISGGTGSTISGTVVSPDTGSTGPTGGSPHHHSSSSSSSDNPGEVLGASTGPDGVGGGGDLTPGVPNTGTGPDATLYLTLLGSLMGVLGGAYALRYRLQ